MTTGTRTPLSRKVFLFFFPENEANIRLRLNIGRYTISTALGLIGLLQFDLPKSWIGGETAAGWIALVLTIYSVVMGFIYDISSRQQADLITARSNNFAAAQDIGLQMGVEATVAEWKSFNRAFDAGLLYTYSNASGGRWRDDIDKYCLAVHQIVMAMYKGRLHDLCVSVAVPKTPDTALKTIGIYPSGGGRGVYGTIDLTLTDKYCAADAYATERTIYTVDVQQLTNSAGTPFPDLQNKPYRTVLSIPMTIPNERGVKGILNMDCSNPEAFGDAADQLTINGLQDLEGLLKPLLTVLCLAVRAPEVQTDVNAP